MSCARPRRVVGASRAASIQGCLIRSLTRRWYDCSCTNSSVPRGTGSNHRKPSQGEVRGEVGRKAARVQSLQGQPILGLHWNAVAVVQAVEHSGPWGPEALWVRAPCQTLPGLAPLNLALVGADQAAASIPLVERCRTCRDLPCRSCHGVELMLDC